VIAALESDASGIRIRGLHQLAKHFKRSLNVVVMVGQRPFDFGETLCEIGVLMSQLSYPDERPHDRDVDLHGAVAAEHAGQHRNSLFREDIR